MSNDGVPLKSGLGILRGHWKWRSNAAGASIQPDCWYYVSYKCVYDIIIIILIITTITRPAPL